jgi:hypothetical protein
VTAIIVPLDEAAKRQWAMMAKAVERAGMTLWPWVEVARNPAMADAHPEWMAAIGAHHDDWRRRFPNAPAAKSGEVIKAWPWVPIGYVPAFDAHRERLKTLLGDLPGAWSGVFLNDLQAGPRRGCGMTNAAKHRRGSLRRQPRRRATMRRLKVVTNPRTTPGKAIIPLGNRCDWRTVPMGAGRPLQPGSVRRAVLLLAPSTVEPASQPRDPIAVGLCRKRFARPDTLDRTGLALFQARHGGTRGAGKHRRGSGAGV